MKQNILTSTGEKILTLNIAQDYGQNLMAWPYKKSTTIKTLEPIAILKLATQGLLNFWISQTSTDSYKV